MNDPTRNRIHDLDGMKANVPVFSCIIHVARDTDGSVKARVANLPDMAVSAASERDALASLVATFKQRTADWLKQDADIPWIEPPSPAEPGEETRFIPVHL